MQIVSNHYNVTIDDLKGKKRNSNITIPRQIAMYISRVYLEESLPKIASEFGGKDHTTVMHSVDKIKKEVEKDENLNIDIQRLVNQIQWKK